MTVNEAINVLKMVEAHGCLVIEAKTMAIQALEEIQQYRAIGTVEEFKAMVSENFTKDLLNVGYAKGIKDGYVKAIDEFAERLNKRLHCAFSDDLEIQKYVNEIAEEMRGEEC